MSVLKNFGNPAQISRLAELQNPQLVNAQLSSEFSDADMGNEVSDSQVAPTELDTQILDDENPFASPWKDKPISDDVSRPVARPLAAEDKNLPVLVVNDSPERVNTAKIKADRIAQKILAKGFMFSIATCIICKKQADTCNFGKLAML